MDNGILFACLFLAIKHLDLMRRPIVADSYVDIGEALDWGTRRGSWASGEHLPCRIGLLQRRVSSDEDDDDDTRDPVASAANHN